MFNKRIAKEYSEYEKELQEYYWKCFISEFSKIIIFLLIFIFLNLTKEYIAALLYLMLLRNNGGGLHCKHYVSCLLVSFTFLFGSILLAMYVTPPQIFIYISILLSALIGYHLVPITSTNRPAATFEQVKKSKRTTTVIILLFFILLCICPHNTYIYIGYWTIILHIFQLIIAYSIKEVKKNVQLGR